MSGRVCAKPPKRYWDAIKRWNKLPNHSERTFIFPSEELKKIKVSQMSSFKTVGELKALLASLDVKDDTKIILAVSNTNRAMMSGFGRQVLVVQDCKNAFGEQYLMLESLE